MCELSPPLHKGTVVVNSVMQQHHLVDSISSVFSQAAFMFICSIILQYFLEMSNWTSLLYLTPFCLFIIILLNEQFPFYCFLPHFSSFPNQLLSLIMCPLRLFSPVVSPSSSHTHVSLSE